MITNLALFSLSIALPMALLFVVLHRWWVKRDKRRSSLCGKLHHAPGEQLLTRIRDHDDELLLAVMLTGPHG